MSGIINIISANGSAIPTSNTVSVKLSEGTTKFKGATKLIAPTILFAEFCKTQKISLEKDLAFNRNMSDKLVEFLAKKGYTPSVNKQGIVTFNQNTSGGNGDDFNDDNDVKEKGSNFAGFMKKPTETPDGVSKEAMAVLQEVNEALYKGVFAGKISGAELQDLLGEDFAKYFVIDQENGQVVTIAEAENLKNVRMTTNNVLQDITKESAVAAGTENAQSVDQ